MTKIIIISLLLSGCATIVPVSTPFPPAPKELMVPPKSMKSIDEKNIHLSSFLSRVIDNNTICLENEIKLRAWQSWYEQQRALYRAGSHE